MRLGHHPLALLSAEEVWGRRKERSRVGERRRTMKRRMGGRGREREGGGEGERGNKKDFILL